MAKIFPRLLCPDCRKPIREEEKICPHCGADLDAPLPPEITQSIIHGYFEKAKNGLENGKDLQTALRNCEEFLQYLPGSSEGHNLHGLILHSLDREDEAYQAFQESLRIDPDNPYARENLESLTTECQNILSSGVLGRPKPAKRRWVIGVGGIITAFFLLAFVAICGVFGYLVVWPQLNQVTYVYEPDLSKISTVTPSDLEQTAHILTDRWHSLGSWVSVSASGDHLIARIPKKIDAKVIESTKAIGLVEFVAFGAECFADGTKIQTDYDYPFLSQENGLTWLGADMKWPTFMTGKEIKKSSVSEDQSGQAILTLEFTTNGKEILAEFSRKNIGYNMGILLDKKLFACPKISNEIPDGIAIIQGNLSKQSAIKFAAVLHSGPLPIPLK